MRERKCPLVSIPICCLLFLQLSCGGGGDGGGGAPPAAQPTTVSGSVQAPGGQVTFNQPQGFLQQFARFICPLVYATVTGLSPVADGSTVQLVRLNATGTSFTVLASSTTAGGRYSFNLTSLGLQPSNDLVVRVANGAVQMRAFLTGSNIDIDPATEASVRMVLDQIAANPGATLSQFTLSELRDITGAVNQLATVNQLAAGINIETTVMTIKNAVSADAGLTAFMTAAADSGQTTEGPGDIGNYFPLANGTMWTFQGTHAETSMPTVNFTNTLGVQGTKPVGAVTTTVVAESNPLNSGSAEETYYLKDSRGILNYGNNDGTDTLSQKLIPYREILFPLNVGFASEVVNKNGVDFGQDLDQPPDGKNETADVQGQVTVEKFENVTVPKGTFSNVAKIVQKITITVFSSAGSGSVTVVSTQTIWIAPGIGPVKRQTVIQDLGGQSIESSSEELIDVVMAKQISLATNDIIYDPGTMMIYASTPGSPGTITPIDPITGTLGTPIPVGNEPMKLARSDNGQYLYVSLDGEGAVQRVDLATQTAGAKFSLGSGSFLGPYYVEDMEVLPGNSQAIAVSRKYKGVTPGHAGVAIYDNGIQRPNTIPDSMAGNVIAFGQSASILYGYDNEISSYGFQRMAVDASGVTLIDVTGNLIGGSGIDILFAQGLIYASSGQTINPVTLMQVGSYLIPMSVIPGGAIPVVDSSKTEATFITQASFGDVINLHLFNLTDFQLLRTSQVEGVSGIANNLIRWGTDGLAFRTSGSQVFLIEPEK